MNKFRKKATKRMGAVVGLKCRCCFPQGRYHKETKDMATKIERKIVKQDTERQLKEWNEHYWAQFDPEEERNFQDPTG